MTATLDNIVDQLELLPEGKRQQWFARFAHELADAQVQHQLTDEERDLVREGLADLDAGRVVSEAQRETFWNRNRRG